MSKQLNTMARDLVGDGKSPNLYFVSNGSTCIMVTSDARAAYRKWKQLASKCPLSECILEDRLTGTICCVEPKEDAKDSPLMVWDDSEKYMQGVYA